LHHHEEVTWDEIGVAAPAFTTADRGDEVTSAPAGIAAMDRVAHDGAKKEEA
jgi:hypothetical protein